MSQIRPVDVLSRKTAELVFAVVLLMFGIAIIVGAREMETGWGSSGPEAGYFPLRIGMLIVAAALLVLGKEALSHVRREAFLSLPAAKNVVLFALPLVLLIATIPWIGLYLAAAGYLLLSIGFVGRVHWVKALTIAMLTPVLMFVLFEFAFKTPLPKGPLGPLFGMI
jgi:putative tricarboxylic transport membrane protein